MSLNNAILKLPMPRSCYECKLAHYLFSESSNTYAYICGYDNTNVSQYCVGRNTLCPLEYSV